MYTKQIHPEHLVARDIKVFHFFSTPIKKEGHVTPTCFSRTQKKGTAGEDITTALAKGKFSH